MKTNKLRILSLLLSVLLIASMLPPSVIAEEPTDELTQETIDRVYDEVLTGEITSTEDVLRVALAQYEARQTTTYGMRSGSNANETEGETPTITQIIETITDENGVTTELVADTGLLVVDENGEETSTVQLYRNGFNSLDAYSITATHTVYFYYRNHFNGLIFDTEEVKLARVKTTLYYNSSFSATKLEQYYFVDTNGISDSDGLLMHTVNNPAENMGYYATTSQANWEDLITDDSDMVPGFTCRAVFYYGSASKEITVEIVKNYNGIISDGTWT